jgi:3-oxoadipate enol-lactonase
MSFATINGVQLWYEEKGSGEPIVQIHGCGFGHYNFSTATPYLSDYFRVIDLDLRGYGQSDQPIQRYDMEVWADDIAGLMEYLGINKAHIHGTSMGGMVAQQFAAKYPEKVDRLVINCSAAKLDYAGKLTFRNWIDIAEHMGVGSRTLAELISMQALSRSFLDSENGESAVDMVQEILQNSNNKEVFKRACQAMIDMDLRPLLPKITAETLVIGGDEDIMTPWEVGPTGAGQQYIFENISNSTKYVIKGSNHSSLFDNAEENCSVVRDFFNGKVVG